MDTLHQHRRRLTHFLAATALAFLFLAPASAFTFNPSRQFNVGFGGRKMREAVVDERVVARRRLVGPGSSPPSCRSKCGRCRPCQPVHVPIHPGFSMKLEYYPEAWRCKCKDKLFMP